VSFQNGLLVVTAENATLSDILGQVRTQTGASIDIPPAAANQRVAIRVGPAPARDVLVSLLSGSGYDYVILGAMDDPERLQRVILTSRQNVPVQSASAPANAAAAQVNTDDSDADEAPPVVPPRPVANQPPPGLPPRPADSQPQVVIQQQPFGQPQVQVQPGQQQTGQQQPGQQQVKTPQQLLEELQRLQQQRQQQQQNPQPQPQD